MATLKPRVRLPKAPARPTCKKHGCLLSIGPKNPGKCVLFDHFPKGGTGQVEAYRRELKEYYDALAELEGFVEVSL